jgi:hypothetical protein
MKTRHAALAAAMIVAGVVGLSVAASPAETPPPPDDPPAIVDARDQYALVQEIISASDERPLEIAAALDEVRRGWKGHRYRWEVALVPALCRAGHTCLVMPFDHLRHRDLEIVQGWLPRLELTRQVHDALLHDCEPHRQCVFTFEGELDRFVLNVEDPTSLAFTDVEILSVRGATPEESWIRRPRKRGALSGNPSVVGHRTPLRAEPR